MMNRLNRVTGMILGAIAGDSLGRPYVFMRSRELFARSRQVCWEVLDPGMSSQLMMTTLRTVRQYGVDMHKIANSYRRYVMTGAEIDCVTAMWSQGQTNVYNDTALCGNQLLVRQIPIVLAGLGWDRMTLMNHIEKSCQITHEDSETLEYAQIYGLCLQGILQGKSRVEIWDELFAFVGQSPVRTTLLSTYYERPVADGVDFHHASIAFCHALYHFWHDTPLISALRSVVLSGGATDINASSTGALLGAWHGDKIIPDSWREVLFEHSGMQIKAALKDAENIYSRCGLVLDHRAYFHAKRYPSSARKLAPKLDSMVCHKT